MNQVNTHPRFRRMRCCFLALVVLVGPPALVVTHFWLVAKLGGAVGRGDVAAVKWITLIDRWTINSPTDIDPMDSYPAFSCACRTGRADIVECLIRRGGNVNWHAWDGETPLNAAVYSGSIRTIKLLLRSGANPNSEPSISGTPLQEAIRERKPAAVAALLNGGADPNWAGTKPGWFRVTPLHDACDLDDPAMARILLVHGAAPNASDGNGETPLDRAIAGAHSRLADLLEKHGGRASNPPVFRAAAFGQLAEVRQAVSRDPEWVRRRSRSKCTLLMYAVKNGRDRVAAYLLSQGARLYPEAMWDAVDSRNTEMVRLLARSGASVNLPEPGGSWSVLHAAVYNDDQDMVKCVLSLGVDTSTIFQGETALQLAERKGHKQIARTIREWERAHPRSGAEHRR